MIRYKEKDYRVFYEHHRKYTKDTISGEFSIRPMGGDTVAWIEREGDGNSIIKCTIAECSLNETFCKAKGRMIALGRLLKELSGAVLLEPKPIQPDTFKIPSGSTLTYIARALDTYEILSNCPKEIATGVIIEWR